MVVQRRSLIKIATLTQYLVVIYQQIQATLVNRQLQQPRPAHLQGL